MLIKHVKPFSQFFIFPFCASINARLKQHNLTASALKLYSESKRTPRFDLRQIKPEFLILSTLNHHNPTHPLAFAFVIITTKNNKQKKQRKENWKAKIIDWTEVAFIFQRKFLFSYLIFLVM